MDGCTKSAAKPGCKAKRGKESAGKGSSRVSRAFRLTLRKLRDARARTEFNPVLTNGALFVSSHEKDSYNLYVYSTFLEAKFLNQNTRVVSTFIRIT